MIIDDSSVEFAASHQTLSFGLGHSHLLNLGECGDSSSNQTCLPGKSLINGKFIGKTCENHRTMFGHRRV